MTKPRFVKRLMAGGGALAVLALARVAHAAPQRESSAWSLPRDVSRDGYRIDWLINITTIFCIILFVIMCGWMAWAVSPPRRSMLQIGPCH